MHKYTELQDIERSMALTKTAITWKQLMEIKQKEKLGKETLQ